MKRRDKIKRWFIQIFFTTLLALVLFVAFDWMFYEPQQEEEWTDFESKCMKMCFGVLKDDLAEDLECLDKCIQSHLDRQEEQIKFRLGVPRHIIDNSDEGYYKSSEVIE